MRREQPDDTNTDGFDSFLDVVCNLVGILLILIMVVGIRTKKAQITSDSRQSTVAGPTAVTAEMDRGQRDIDTSLSTAPSPALPVQPRSLPDVTTPARDATALRQDAWSLDEERKKLQDETKIQRSYRDQVQLLVALGERDLAAQREALDQNQQALLVQQREAETLTTELAAIQRTMATRKAEDTDPQIIEHHPTPLAKTVFGVEWHYQLKGGRLTYVPMNEFVHRFEDEARRKVWKLENSESVEEEIGPIDNFMMRYVLGRRTQIVRTAQGTVQREGVGLIYFKLVPNRPVLGVTLEEALQEGSEFVTRLRDSPAEDTTITVWTYPDSFAEYHHLKKFVWERGYTIAARPLPDGVLIGGSPDGTKSAAQ